jgi:hypothetical protein
MGSKGGGWDRFGGMTASDASHARAQEPNENGHGNENHIPMRYAQEVSALRDYHRICSI